MAEGCLKTNYFTGLLDAAFDVALAAAECATAADKLVSETSSPRTWKTPPNPTGPLKICEPNASKKLRRLW